jgi:hypothetical protein
MEVTKGKALVMVSIKQISQNGDEGLAIEVCPWKRFVDGTMHDGIRWNLDTDQAIKETKIKLTKDSTAPFKDRHMKHDPASNRKWAETGNPPGAEPDGHYPYTISFKWKGTQCVIDPDYEWRRP